MSAVTSSVVYICVLNVLMTGGTSFILDSSTCLTPPPCSCSPHGTFQRCDSKNLTVLPRFDLVHVSTNVVYFYFQDNQLTTIPANSFANLFVPHSTRIDIDLSYNRIYSIASNAFAGIEDNIISIDLDNNNLTSLPSVLESMSSLDILHLRNNPIISLNPNTMRMIGRSLTVLRIDLKGFNSWPREVGFLTSLVKLYVRYINTTQLELSAFDGFASSLKVLAFLNSNLERIPQAVSHLRQLDTLALENNNITVIRDSDLSNLGKLDMLDLDFNPINAVSQHAFDNNTALTEVYLQSTSLRHIPTAIRVLPKLVMLSFAGSRIECDCSMSALKSWNVTGMLLSGMCSNSNLQINTYLLNGLPNCP